MPDVSEALKKQAFPKREIPVQFWMGLPFQVAPFFLKLP
jgi:hypothetical protein